MLLKRGLVTAFMSLAVAVLTVGGSPAEAGQCTQLAQLAQQSAAYYRNSGDQHHYAAARNYQNAYNGCVGAIRQKAQAVTGQTLGGSTNAFDITMNVLGTLNSWSKGDQRRRAYEREIAAETQRQQDLVRQQEAELQRQLKAARLAQEKAASEARERARQEQIENARLRSRCAKNNPFGRNSDSCADYQNSDSPFARRNPGANNPFASVSNDTPDWERGRRGHSTYDSVNGVDCPEMFLRGCVPDSWRQMLARLDRDFNGDINAALLAAYDRQQAAQSSALLYMDTLTADQYRRLGTGEASFADIALERSQMDFEPVSLSSLEAKLAEIDNDPTVKQAFQKALDEAMKVDQ